jgi:hypothetical protein
MSHKDEEETITYTMTISEDRKSFSLEGVSTSEMDDEDLVLAIEYFLQENLMQCREGQLLC